MKKVIILSLLLVFVFCLPVLAAEEKTLGESKIMIFKYKIHDNAKVDDQIVELNVYDKQTNKQLTSERYIYKGLTNQEVHIEKDSHGMAWSPTSQMILKIDNDGYAQLKITYMKDHDLILKLKATDKKVFVFDVKE